MFGHCDPWDVCGMAEIPYDNTYEYAQLAGRRASMGMGEYMSPEGMAGYMSYSGMSEYMSPEGMAGHYMTANTASKWGMGQLGSQLNMVVLGLAFIGAYKIYQMITE